MSIQYYPNGVGGYPPGDFLDTAKPLQTSGNVWYVSSLIGTDAATPAGQNREKPLATLGQAVSNALAGDIIVLLPGHTQTLGGTQGLTKELTLIGEGVTDGKPSVQFMSSAPALTLFNVLSAGCELRNIYFPQHAVLSTGAKVSGSGDDLLIRGCYFDCGPNDNAAAVSVFGNRVRVVNSTFISTATLTSVQPKSAIEVPAASAITGFAITDTVVSAGTVGFSNFSAIDLSLATSVARLRIEGLSLLLGADANFGAGIVTGRCNVQLATGGSRVNWS